MFVNLSDVFAQTGKQTKQLIPIELTSFDGAMGSYPLKAAEPVMFTFSNKEKDRAVVEASADFSFEATCDRCLSPVQVDLSLSIEREVSSPDYVIEDEEDESREFMEGYQLDIEALLYNEITVNWPVKILCREDCKGLCPVCGRNLNEEDCGCDTFVPDPRMAAFQDIFKSCKEV